MKKQLLLFLVFSVAISTVYSQGLIEIRIKKTETIDGVDVSSDDAEQENNAIDKLFDDDLDAGWEGDDFNVLTCGMRFTDITIPQGATIDSAWIEVFSHEEENDPTTIEIWGDAVDNSVTFDTVNLITDRTPTSATVTWTVTDMWAIWTMYRTADITSIVQELVSRPGWASGNAMSFIFEGQDLGASALDEARDMESFENEADPDDGGDGLNHPERIPKLVVYYDGYVETGIYENKNKVAIDIYPNPANDLVTISVPSVNRGINLQLAVFDLSGQLVLETTATNGSAVDFSQLAAGTYTLNISTNKLNQNEILLIK